MRREFEMTEEEFRALKLASQPVPYIIVGGFEPRSQQQNANEAWDDLGRKRGFIGASVEGSRKGVRFFTAEVCEPAKDWTP